MGSPTLLVLWSSLSSSTPINTAAKPRFSYPRLSVPSGLQIFKGVNYGLTDCLHRPQSNQSVSSPHRTIPLSFDISQPPPALGLKSKFYLSLRLRAPSRDQSSRLHHHLHSSCAIFWPTPHSPRHTGAPKNMPRYVRWRRVYRRVRARGGGGMMPSHAGFGAAVRLMRRSALRAFAPSSGALVHARIPFFA